MTRPGQVCRCWRMVAGQHVDFDCPFKGMHWRDVADLQDERDEPDFRCIGCGDEDCNGVCAVSL